MNAFDPDGLYDLPAHQKITKIALVRANLVNYKAFKNLPHHASWSADVNPDHFTWYGAVHTETAYQHSTTTTIDGVRLGAEETKQLMMDQAKTWYESGDPEQFGRMIHMVEDSFCTSHTARDPVTGEITAFLDYFLQEELYEGEHKRLDSFRARDRSIRADAINAVDAVVPILKMAANGADWAELAAYLDEYVWILSEGAETGIAGDLPNRDAEIQERREEQE